VHAAWNEVTEQRHILWYAPDSVDT
jgi:hypothetical protein